MTRTVALLGATGYTGRLTAAELTRRGIPHRLGGRSAARLEAVPSTAERHVVDLASASSLDAFLDGADVLITCVGPFTLHGMPVVEAAVRTGTPYVDSTGEFGFMSEVYGRFRDAATAVVPACGFDYIPGDLAAAVAVAELGGTADTVDVVYRLRGGKPTRGTALSAAAAMGGAQLTPARIAFDGPDGPLTAVVVPWGEQVTVPLHVPGAAVRSGIAAPDLLTRAAAASAPLAPLLAPLTRLAAPLVGRLAERLPEGPEESVRGQAEALVVARAGSGGRTATVAVRCRDGYGLTARLLVEASQQIEGTGAMATAEAVQAREFLDAVSYEDGNGALSWEVL
ncbi:MAG: saccharopine dehydrogenase NADP-binding domain-containing protein [Actinobacteria bacterium]|nr:saccharopine dehydrogenase NADP-binding domain-containing protein [Actinomycetota bacterium]MCA1720875.1 saccharopine dehydrogenase NADP-binding domain-containing protein [Actinomycetota bacterium]